MSENLTTPPGEPVPVPTPAPIQTMDLAEEEVQTAQPGPVPVEAASAAVPDPEPTPAAEERKIPSQYVQLNFPVYMEVKEGEFDPTRSTLTLPAADPEDLAADIASAPDLKLDDTPLKAEWADMLEQGFIMMARDKRFKSTLMDPRAMFRQSIKTAVGELMSKTPNFTSVENQDLAGEKGLLQFMQYMQMGSQFKVFLPHSGFWITLKAPTEDQLLDLNTEMANDKIDHGRNSYGLTFSSLSAYATERVVNLALSCKLAVSVDITTKSLKQLILSPDIPMLIWGLANSIWTNGHQYQRACANIPGGCAATLKAKLDLSKLAWIDNNALTEWQLRHLSNHGANKMTEADVLRYQRESLKMQSQEVKFLAGRPNELGMTLKIPTLEEYFMQSHAWLSEIVDEINRAVGVDSNERNALIDERCRASWMRQFTHWVESIQLTATNSRLVDSDTIANAISRLSSQDNVREDFLKEVNAFIDRTTMAVIGIPAYRCPVCEKDHGPTDAQPGFTNILPIDMVKTFFILNVQKVLSIRSRSSTGA